MTEYNITNAEVLEGVKCCEKTLIKMMEFKDVKFLRWADGENENFLIATISKNGKEVYLKFTRKHFDAFCHFPLNIQTMTQAKDRLYMTQCRQELITESVTQLETAFPKKSDFNELA